MSAILAWLSQSWLGRQVEHWLMIKAAEVLKEAWYYLGSKLKNKKREVEQKHSVEKLEEVLNDPKATHDEKGKAYEEFNNSGR